MTTPGKPPETPAKPKKRTRTRGTTTKKKAKTAAKNGPGRPAGPSGGKIPEVVGELTRCKKCDSTERVAYYGTISRDLTGERNGKRFNRVTWKRTKCASCHQARTDVFYEWIPAD